MTASPEPTAAAARKRSRSVPPDVLSCPFFRATPGQEKAALEREIAALAQGEPQRRISGGHRGPNRRWRARGAAVRGPHPPVPAPRAADFGATVHTHPAMRRERCPVRRRQTGVHDPGGVPVCVVAGTRENRPARRPGRAWISAALSQAWRRPVRRRRARMAWPRARRRSAADEMGRGEPAAGGEGADARAEPCCRRVRPEWCQARRCRPR